MKSLPALSTNSPRQEPTSRHEADLERFHELYSLRSSLAGFAARRAAERVAAGASTHELEECFEAMLREAGHGDYAAFLQADSDFHLAIANLVAMPVFVEMWKLMAGELRDFVAWVQKSVLRDLTMIALAHRGQLEAIVNGQPADAEHAAQVDLDALWQMLAEQPARPDGEPDPVERVCAYVVLNLHHRLSLEKIAREVAFLSPSRFSQLFRKSRGESFVSYVHGLRLRRAVSLLERTPLPVQDIALRVGFTDVSRFAAYFRRQFGCSPTQWRDGVRPAQ